MTLSCDFYGETIGQIAHSHWWSVSRVEQELSEDLGAYPSKTKSRIDRVKLACLLRIADALHLDQRRAPRFLRALTNPQGISALHWSFQERLAVPHIEHEAVVFTAGAPFRFPMQMRGGLPTIRFRQSTKNYRMSTY